MAEKMALQIMFMNSIDGRRDEAVVEVTASDHVCKQFIYQPKWPVLQIAVLPVIPLSLFQLPGHINVVRKITRVIIKTNFITPCRIGERGQVVADRKSVV